MRCELCLKEGNHDSKVVVGVTDVRLGGIVSYRDAEGRDHYHDAKKTRRDYTCTYGHKWSSEVVQRCFCGWSADGPTEG